MMETIIGGVVAFFASGGGTWLVLKMRLDNLEKELQEAKRATKETRSRLHALQNKIEWLRRKFIELGVTPPDDESGNTRPGEDTDQRPPHSGARA